MGSTGLSKRDVMQKYNDVLKRFWKATIYLEADNLTEKQQEKWMPEYEKVVKECQSYLTQLYNLGYRATEEEIKGGFDLEKEEEVEQLQI